MRQNYFKIITVMIMLMGISIITDAQPTSGAKLPTGKKIIIQSAVHYGRGGGGCWEKPGGGSMAVKGDNIRVWDIDNAATKRFTLVESGGKGWYEIYIGNIKTSRIDVAGGKSANGTNVLIWEKNGKDNQKFLFKYLGYGRYKIYTKTGKIVNLKNYGAANGTNVQIWNDHDGLHNEWYLLDALTQRLIEPTGSTILDIVELKGVKITSDTYYIQSAMSYGRSNNGYLEFPGNDWNKKGNMMGIWTKDSNPNKLFKFEKPRRSAYYNIRAARSNNGVIDCKGGRTDKGTPLQLWEIGDNNQAQQFYLKHLDNGRFKIYHKSGKVICLKDNRHDNNGNKVHLWDDHNAITTNWYLINAGTGKIFVPDGKSKN